MEYILAIVIFVIYFFFSMLIVTALLASVGWAVIAVVNGVRILIEKIRD